MAAVSVKRALWTFVTAMLLLAVLFAALPVVASSRIVRDRIAYELAAMTGYRVAIGSAPDIHFWPDLRAVIRDVTLSPWTDPDKPVLKTERMELGLSAWAALGGRVAISSAELVRPTIVVEQMPSGFHAPVPPGGGRVWRAISAARSALAASPTSPDLSRAAGVEIGTIKLRDGRIVQRMDNGEIIDTVTSLNAELDLSVLNDAGSLSGRGSWHNEQVSFSLSSPNPLMLLAGGSGQLVADLDSPWAKGRFAGKASLASEGFFQGDGQFSTSSLRRLTMWWSGRNVPGVSLGPLELAGQINGGGERYRLENASLSIDGNAGGGGLELRLPPGKLPMLTGTLAFKALDLGTLLAAFSPTARTSYPSGSPEILDVMNIDLRLSAEQAKAAGVSLSDVAATARITDGMTALDMSDADAFGGTVQGSLRFDRRPEGPWGELTMVANDVDGGAFATAAGLTRLVPVGRGKISISLKGPGGDWNAVLARGAGSFAASFGEGALSGFNLTRFLERSRKGGFFALDEVTDGTMTTLAVDLAATIANGVISIDKAEARSAGYRIALAGLTPYASRGLALTGRVEQLPPPAPATPSPETTGSTPPAVTAFFVGGSWGSPFISLIPNLE